MSDDSEKPILSHTIIEPSSVVRNALFNVQLGLQHKFEPTTKLTGDLKTFAAEVGLCCFVALAVGQPREARAFSGYLLAHATHAAIDLYKSIECVLSALLDIHHLDDEERRRIISGSMLSVESLGDRYKVYENAREKDRVIFFLNQFADIQRAHIASLLSAPKYSLSAEGARGTEGWGYAIYPGVAAHLRIPDLNHNLNTNPALLGLLYAKFEIDKIIRGAGLHALGIRPDVIDASVQELDKQQKALFDSPTPAPIRNEGYMRAMRDFNNLTSDRRRPN